MLFHLIYKFEAAVNFTSKVLFQIPHINLKAAKWCQLIYKISNS